MQQYAAPAPTATTTPAEHALAAFNAGLSFGEFAARVDDLAARLLTAHGASFGNMTWQHVADLDRAASLRRDYAADLVRAEARRKARFATAPCALCGQAFDGERTDLGGEPACGPCIREFAEERGWHAPAEFAPLAPAAVLAGGLRAAPELEPWESFDVAA